MSQVFNNLESIGALTKTSNTVVSLAQSTVTIGGRQYTGAANLDITTNGFNGLDIGAVVANSFYYVYVVVNAGVLGIVASLSKVSPTGFTSWKLVDGFYTDGLGAINSVDNQKDLVEQYISSQLGTIPGTNFDMPVLNTILENTTGFLVTIPLSGVWLLTVVKTTKIDISTSFIKSAIGSGRYLDLQINTGNGFKRRLITGRQAGATSTPDTYEEISHTEHLKTGDLVKIVVYAEGGSLSEANINITAQAESPLIGLIKG